MRFPGTLTARILIGFTVLVVTFGGISVSTVMTIDQLNRAIRIIRVGYLELALASRDLADRQDALRSYLRDELAGERSLRRVRNRLRVLRANRERMLSDAETILAQFREMEEVQGQQHLARSEKSLRAIRAMVDESEPLYDRLLAAPPIEGANGDAAEPAGTDPAVLAQAAAALEELRPLESRIKYRTDGLKGYLSDRVKDTSEQLENASRKVRLFTILWGITAVVLGILVTVWATVWLRPLRRLRDGAKRIAEGEYADRIDVAGSSEIADLAREFNVMGHAIQERERELVRTERLATVGKMAAMITHEVRNPLSSIGLNTELLEEELADLPPERAGEARALCRAITGEVDRLTGITEEYLRFARLPKPKLQEESLSRLVEDVVDFERGGLAQRGVRVDLALDEELPAVPLDEAQIRQALLNLLRNAADALEGGGGVVSVRTRRRGERAVVEVSDDGPGIPADVLEKLFDPFVSTKEGGTGLGLALSQQIAREHGGAIEVESREGAGATFFLVLPLAGGDRLV